MKKTVLIKNSEGVQKFVYDYKEDFEDILDIKAELVRLVQSYCCINNVVINLDLNEVHPTLVVYYKQGDEEFKIYFR